MIFLTGFKVIAQEPRDVQWVEELSAGIKGSRIPEVLEKLSKPVENGQEAVRCVALY